MAFATAQDVADRLAKTLTTLEQTAATAVIDTVTGLIAYEAGETDAWATALSPVPAYYKALCIDKTVLALVNPTNAESTSESLGAYSNHVIYTRGTAHELGIFLDDDEVRKVRQIANNAVSVSVPVHSLLHDVYVREAP